MNIIAVDCETKGRDTDSLSEAVQSYFLKSSDRKKGLGLHPHIGELTCVGFYGVAVQEVMRPRMLEGQATFAKRVHERLTELRSEGFEFVWQKGLFDVRFLGGVMGWAEDFTQFLDYDTRTMAHTSTRKIPDQWLRKYSAKRDKLNAQLPQGVSHRPGSQYSLKCLAPFFLGVEWFWEDPTNHDSDEYVLKDCEYTLGLYNYFRKALEEDGELSFYDTKAKSWDKMLARATCRGISLNYDVMAELEVEFSQRREAAKKKLDVLWFEGHAKFRKGKVDKIIAESESKCQKAIEKLKDKTKVPGTIARYKGWCQAKVDKVPKRLNYDSSKQMLWLLRDHLGYDVTDVNDEEGTGKEILKLLAGSGHDDVGVFLEYRQAHKVLSSYFPSYRAYSHNGALHAFFNSGGARTGRISSSSPNLQQVPSELYRVFKPKEGYSFIGYDAAAIEARIIAAISGDPRLLEIVANDHSIHDYNTKYIFFDDIDCDVTEVKSKYPKHRQCSKTIGFALFYGAGAKRIKAAMTAAGFPISLARAKQLLKRFRSYYAVATEFHQDITAVFEEGDVVFNLVGRPIKIQNKKDAYMKGFNTLVQSAASDIILRAAELCEQEYQRRGLDAYPLAFVHDYIKVEARDDILEEADRILVDNMTRFSIECHGSTVKMGIEGYRGKEWKK